MNLQGENVETVSQAWRFFSTCNLLDDVNIQTRREHRRSFYSGCMFMMWMLCGKEASKIGKDKMLERYERLNEELQDFIEGLENDRA
jgi:hypothetical protein